MLQIDNTHVTAPLTHDWQWDAVARRDRRADGQFVYAVTSTRIFCRPSCPSRRPRRSNVRFFATADAAIAAGFRACKRCEPGSTSRQGGIDDAIGRATRYLDAHADASVSLSKLAGVVGVSAYHLQRRFKGALGVSPREYQAARRAERFRRELREGRDVAGATYEAGYGSPSRVYAAAPTGVGMSPATYRRGGAGATIGFVTVQVALGTLLVAATPKGLCAVKLGDNATTLEKELRREFEHADIQPDVIVKAEWIRFIVSRLDGRGPGRPLDLPLDVRGTAFQWRVWRALQQIPQGETRSYADVARSIGRPSAARAVARACASNPVCLAIPCHRVVATGGGLGGYRWGVSRKQQLLKQEKSKVTK